MNLDLGGPLEMIMFVVIANGDMNLDCAPTDLPNLRITNPCGSIWPPPIVPSASPAGERVSMLHHNKVVKVSVHYHLRDGLINKT
jgi:hypothetical protein